MDELSFTFGPPAWIEWNGQLWYRMARRAANQPNGHYRNPGGHLLHRIVWERANGPVPDGLVLHHVDENKANNALYNLRLVTRAEHSELHPGNRTNPNWLAAQRSGIGAAVLWATREPQPHNCEECGVEFFSTGMRAKFCHQNCRARNRRRLLKEAALSRGHLRPDGSDVSGVLR